MDKDRLLTAKNGLLKELLKNKIISLKNDIKRTEKIFRKFESGEIITVKNLAQARLNV